MGEARFGERPTIEIAKHEPQVPGTAQCSRDGLDRIPVAAILDVRCPWRELARKKGTDLLAEGAVFGIENEIAHRASLECLLRRPPRDALDLALDQGKVRIADRWQEVARTAHFAEVDAGSHEVLAIARRLRERATERIDNP